MNDDYVKRSDVHKVFQPKYAPAINKTFAAMIDSVPAADVVERKVGHWIFHPEQKNIYGGKLIECSECKTQYLVMNVVEEIYCRQCGSKNRQGGQDT